jgi:hypothetical protein
MKNKFIYAVVDTCTGDTLYTDNKPNLLNFEKE